jgi:uncharacterized membrane protein
MTELVVLGFNSRRQAEEVWEVARQLSKEELIDFQDAAMAWRDDTGEIKIQQAVNAAKAGAVGGALWGTLIGAIFLVPVIGLAAGAAGGALAGKMADVGVDEAMVQRIAAQLEPGRAAIFALIRRSTPDKVVDALRPYHPTVLRTSLSKEREEDLVEALGVPVAV